MKSIQHKVLYKQRNIFFLDAFLKNKWFAGTEEEIKANIAIAKHKKTLGVREVVLRYLNNDGTYTSPDIPENKYSIEEYYDGSNYTKSSFNENMYFFNTGLVKKKRKNNKEENK